MSKSQLPIFATQSDLQILMGEVGRVRSIRLAMMGLFEQTEPQILPDKRQIQQLTSYLVFEGDVRVSSRPVPQRNGGIKFAVDPMGNPDSIVLRCGGRLDVVRLTAGDLSLATDSVRAKELFRIFSGCVRHQYQKIRSYYVGPEAVQFLDQGGRLSPTAKSPLEFDLSR